MYRLVSSGRLNVKVGQRYEPLSAFSDFEKTDEEPDSTPVEQPLDDGVETQPDVLAKPSAGAFTCTLSPPELASPAFRAVRKAFKEGDRVDLEAYLGKYRLVVEQAAGANAATLAIAKAAGAAGNLLTLGEKGNGNDAIGDSFGTSETNRGGNPIDRGHIVEIGGVAYYVGQRLSGTTRRVYRIGAIANGVATQDDVELANVAASDAFKVHEWVLHLRFTARLTQATSLAAARDGLSSTVAGTLQEFESESFLLKPFAWA